MATFNIVNSQNSKSKIIINEDNPWQIKYQQLEQQIVTIKKNAFNAGYQQCKNTLEDCCQEKIMSEHNQLEKFKEETVALCNDFHDQLQVQLKTEIVKLSLSIAEKIVGAKLNENYDITKNTIEEIIEHITDYSGAVIFVSNETHIHLMKNGIDYLPSELSIKVDSRLKKGDCRLESPSGIIDATIASRLHILEEKLIANMNEK